MRRVLLIAVVVSLHVGCGKGDGSASGGTSASYSGYCQDSHSCMLYAGYSSKSLFDEVAASCQEDKNSTWVVADACPATNLVGTCAMPIDDAPADFKGTVTDHSYAPITAAQAEATCKGDKGTFTPMS